eukprot:scaffold1174_cov281-Chaetoceros_neogracile.AAC.6
MQLTPAKTIWVAFRTSGARISVIEKSKTAYNELHSDSVLYSSYDDPSSWNEAIHALLKNTPRSLLSATQSICVSGTSASCLLVDSVTGEPTRGTRAKMYNYDISQTIVNQESNHQVDPNINSNSSTSHDVSMQAQQWIDMYAPKNHAARANTSALSKLLHYHASFPIVAIASSSSHSQEVLVHQSEYVANTIFLSDQSQSQSRSRSQSQSSEQEVGTVTSVSVERKYVSDWHNALKLGYDVRSLEYPEWLLSCLTSIGVPTQVLPSVVAPGERIQTISHEMIKRHGFPEHTMIVGGTTDSNAAFIAAAAGIGGMPSYGMAVTSLGSTLAIKMLSRTFVEDSDRGVYSHRFPILSQHKDGNDNDASFTSARTNPSISNYTSPAQAYGGEELWLVGGASNVGCAVLRQENFSNEELVDLSKDMDFSTDSALKYYPLTKIGERFPIADGKKEPILDPKPDYECKRNSRGEYLKGILQGISQVEVMGFEILGELGANPSFPNVVMTAGGGSKNHAWLKMRERLLRESLGGDAVTVRKAENAEASFGAAVLAASSFT